MHLPLMWLSLFALILPSGVVCRCDGILESQSHCQFAHRSVNNNYRGEILVKEINDGNVRDRQTESNSQR